MVKKNYSSFAELREDIRWFAHNLRTKESDSKIKTTAKDIARLAKRLVETCNEEINSLLLCSQCYEKAYNHPHCHFMMPCEEPHILIWADCDEFGFWPGKLMKFDEDMVHVRFFGDYTNGRIPFSNCFIFSKNSPKNAS